VHHPLVTHGIFVHKGDFNTAARLNANLVLAHGKHHTRRATGVFASRVNGKSIITADAGTALGEGMVIFIHDNAIVIDSHLVTFVT
jgi:hypothetical protein